MLSTAASSYWSTLWTPPVNSTDSPARQDRPPPPTPDSRHTATPHLIRWRTTSTAHEPRRSEPISARVRPSPRAATPVAASGPCRSSIRPPPRPQHSQRRDAVDRLDLVDLAQVLDRFFGHSRIGLYLPHHVGALGQLSSEPPAEDRTAEQNNGAGIGENREVSPALHSQRCCGCLSVVELRVTRSITVAGLGHHDGHGRAPRSAVVLKQLHRSPPARGHLEKGLVGTKIGTCGGR